MIYLATLLAGLALYLSYKAYKKTKYIDRDLTALQGKGEADLENKIIQDIREKDDDDKLIDAAKLALGLGWTLLDLQDNIAMVRFVRKHGGDTQKVNIYYGRSTGQYTYTVATALKHPTKGKNQLYRKYISRRELAEILKNPRTHTDKGYYVKK